MYKVVFIGQPGRGKTTIICNWLGLLKADIVGHSDVDAVSLLPTATGRTTVAEVHIRQCAESSSHIRVEYLPVEQQKTYIKEFCDDYYQRCAGLVPDVTDATAYTDEDRTSHDNARGKTADSPHLEIDRLIRNMVGLPLHREAQRQEIIGSVLRYGSTEDFCNEVVRRANLDNRQQRDFEIEHGDGFREELARLFRGLNNGNLETASIPKRINIDLSPQDIDLHLPEDVDEVIDTIGLDESVRDDLQERLRNPSAICVLVDRLENPPSQPIRSLLESIPTDEHEIVKRKTALFINSNWDELSRVNGADGNPELGIEIKRQEIDRVVRMGNIPYDINNTLFEDPCGAYVVSQNASMHRGLRQQVGRKAQSSIIDYYAEDAEEFRLRINDHLETIARQLRFSEVRVEFTRLKDRTIPAIRAKLDAAQAIGVGMTMVAERLAELEDALVACKKRADDGATDLETAESDAVELKKSADLLEEEARNTPILADIVRKSCGLTDTAHTDDDAPPFVRDEMKTVQRVLEILVNQTDWRKAKKAACILEKAEERKRRLDALVCEWRKLARRLDEIGRLEERTEAVWRGLLWRNPSFAPRRDQMASSVQSSGQFTDALLRITDYTNALNLSLEQLNEERTRQLDSFQAAATERLGESRAILCLHHFEPRPAVLFERTRQGSFEDRCCWILDWYELLFSLYGERQRNAMEGGGGSSLPARAFLRLCEIAGTISVKDETVRDLVAKSRDWDALSRQIEEMMPVDEGQNDDGHRRMFEQARTAIHELTELCDDCQVHSVEVQGAFQRLCEASEWIRNNRLPRERTLSARQKIETDFQSLEALDMPIDSAERDQLLGRGDTLLQQSDFQGSKDAFESCHAGLVNRIGQLTPRLVLRITMPEKCRALTTTFSVVSPQGNPIHFDVNEARNQEWDKLEPEVVYKTHGFRCYVAGRTSVGTFSNSVDVGLIDWHGIREMDVSLWADRFSFPLPGAATPLEFRRAPNGLWYCVQATTITQFRALVITTRSVNVFNQLRSNVCAGMTWNEAVSFATKVTNYALETGFRLPDGTTPIFRLPSPAEWKLGSQYGARIFSSICSQFQEWCTEKNERSAFHCTIKRRNTQWLFHQDWDCKTDSFPFGTGYDSVGFRLVCEST